MDKINVSVSIREASDFEKTLEAASRVGLRIKDKLDLIGVATGSIEKGALAELKGVPGVGAVEEQREIGIPALVRQFR